MPLLNRGPRPAGARTARPSWITAPVVPLASFTVCLLAGGLAGSAWVTWTAFGALAGYSLSGST